MGININRKVEGWTTTIYEQEDGAEIKEMAILHATQGSQVEGVKGTYLGMGAPPLGCHACIATPTTGALDHRRHGSQGWRCC